MATYQSERIDVAATPQSVFAKLGDLSQLAAGGSDKVEATADTVAADLPMAGRMVLRVVERVPYERVVLQAEGSPLPLTVTLLIADNGAGGSTLQLSIEAPLNPFMQGMVERPLKDALAKMSERVRQMNFDEA